MIKKQDTREACKKRYHKLKSQGLCVKCGKNKSIELKTLCLGCKNKHNKRALSYYYLTQKAV